MTNVDPEIRNRMAKEPRYCPACERGEKTIGPFPPGTFTIHRPSGNICIVAMTEVQLSLFRRTHQLD